MFSYIKFSSITTSLLSKNGSHKEISRGNVKIFHAYKLLKTDIILKYYSNKCLPAYIKSGYNKDNSFRVLKNRIFCKHRQVFTMTNNIAVSGPWKMLPGGEVLVNFEIFNMSTKPSVLPTGDLVLRPIPVRF